MSTGGFGYANFWEDREGFNTTSLNVLQRNRCSEGGSKMIVNLWTVVTILFDFLAYFGRKNDDLLGGTFSKHTL